MPKIYMLSVRNKVCPVTSWLQIGPLSTVCLLSLHWDNADEGAGHTHATVIYFKWQPKGSHCLRSNLWFGLNVGQLPELNLHKSFLGCILNLSEDILLHSSKESNLGPTMHRVFAPKILKSLWDSVVTSVFSTRCFPINRVWI